MSANVTTKARSFDILKLTLAIALLLAGIIGFYYFSVYPQVLRVIGLLLLAGLAIALALQTRIGADVRILIQESNLEVRKVVWPTKQETIQSTLLVVALVFVVGIMLWLMDMLLFWVISTLTGQ